MKTSVIKIAVAVLIILLSLQINVFATDITISTETSKDTYSLQENFYVTIDWVENMQATGFTLNYDATKIELVDAFLDEDFYNSDTAGKLIVNWASMDEVDFTNLPFLFKAIGVGEVELSITEVRGFADGNLVVPDNIDYTTKGTKTIEIVSNDYLLNDNLYVRYVKELNDNEASNSESISGFKLTENKLLKQDALANFNSTDYNVRIFSDKRVELEDGEPVGTGAHIEVYTLPHVFEPIGTAVGELVKFYTTVIYGDTTGDGYINSVDALALIKDINNKIPFTSKEYREAGRIICDSSENPTAVDALAIIKHANGKYTINQTKAETLFVTNEKYLPLHACNVSKNYEKHFSVDDYTGSGVLWGELTVSFELDENNNLQMYIVDDLNNIHFECAITGNEATIKTSQLDITGDGVDDFICRIVNDDGRCSYFVATLYENIIKFYAYERVNDKLMYISTNNNKCLLLEDEYSFIETLLPETVYVFNEELGEWEGKTYNYTTQNEEFVVNCKLRDVEARFVSGASFDDDYENSNYTVLDNKTKFTIKAFDHTKSSLLIKLLDGTEGIVYVVSK